MHEVFDLKVNMKLKSTLFTFLMHFCELFMDAHIFDVCFLSS